MNQEKFEAEKNIHNNLPATRAKAMMHFILYVEKKSFLFCMFKLCLVLVVPSELDDFN